MGQPFGATAAVLNFNRVARAIKAVFVRLLHFATSQFYDDFTVIEPRASATTGRELWEEAMAVLGWKIECKVLPGAEFISLGVQFNLAEAMMNGRLVIRNTAKRIADLKREIVEVLRADELRPGRAASLRGKLGFAATQAFGRSGRAGP